jgi:hypothetical protein
MDLTKFVWHVPLIRDLNATGIIIYIYSPACGACKMRAPGFDAEAQGIEGVYRFDASSPAHIKQLADIGFTLKYYPTTLGISHTGRLVVSENAETRASLGHFLEALKRT